MVKKNPEWFLGSNLQCCLHATVLLAVEYSAELYHLNNESLVVYAHFFLS